MFLNIRHKVLIILSMMMFPITANAIDADGELEKDVEEIRRERGYDVPSEPPPQTTPYASSYYQTSSTTSYSSDSETKTRFGLRFAVPFLNVDFDDDSPITGFGIQGFSFVVSFPIFSRLYLEPEIDLLNYRFYWDELEDARLEEYAISIPLTLRFVTSPPPRFGIYVEGGIQWDFAISTKVVEMEGELLEEPESVDLRNVFGYGPTFGGGFQFRVGRMVWLLGYRYVGSSTDFFSDEDGGWGKFTQHQISLGLLF